VNSERALPPRCRPSQRFDGGTGRDADPKAGDESANGRVKDAAELRIGPASSCWCRPPRALNCRASVGVSATVPASPV